MSPTWNVTTVLPVTSLCLLEGEELWQEQLLVLSSASAEFATKWDGLGGEESHCLGTRWQRKRKEGNELGW